MSSAAIDVEVVGNEDVKESDVVVFALSALTASLGASSLTFFTSSITSLSGFSSGGNGGGGGELNESDDFFVEVIGNGDDEIGRSFEGGAGGGAFVSVLPRIIQRVINS